jgi:hypothetical protein
MGTLDKLLHFLKIACIKADISKPQQDGSSWSSRRMVMRFAARGGNGGHTHVDVAAGDFAADTAVLWQALLAMSSPAMNFYAGDN